MKNKVVLVPHPDEAIFTVIYGDENDTPVRQELYQSVFNYRIVAPDTVQLVSPHYNTTLTFKIGSLYINDFDTQVTEFNIIESLGFVSAGFKKGGSASGTTQQHGFIVVPDYLNIETVNRIDKTLQTAVGEVSGLWTADRTGFILLVFDIPLAGRGGYFGGICNIDNITIWEFVEAPGTDVEQFHYKNIFPVTAGQEVGMIVYANIQGSRTGCYFIPPKFIEK